MEGLDAALDTQMFRTIRSSTSEDEINGLFFGGDMALVELRKRAA
jgi:hypothetical protein